MIEKLTHFDENGQAVMVDVTDKRETARTAVTKGKIRVSADTMRAIVEGTAKKGDVLGVARVAGIMAVKRTSELIPLCHPLPLTKCEVDFALCRANATLGTVKKQGRTSESAFSSEDDQKSTSDNENIFTPKKRNSFYIEATCLVKTDGKTGVEMEALTGVQIALLTIYDMCKAIDKGMLITDVHLMSKSGGRSGDFRWEG